MLDPLHEPTEVGYWVQKIGGLADEPIKHESRRRAENLASELRETAR